jgi:DNA-binding FrmR family transcriptional regulator
MLHGTAKNKVLARLRRIAGQVDGVTRMVEEDRYCVDVLLQLASAEAALAQTAKAVLRSHVETCVTDAVASGKPAEQKRKLDELLDVFARHGWGGRAG